MIKKKKDPKEKILIRRGTLSRLRSRLVTTNRRLENQAFLVYQYKDKIKELSHRIDILTQNRDLHANEQYKAKQFIFQLLNVIATSLEAFKKDFKEFKDIETNGKN